MMFWGKVQGAGRSPVVPGLSLGYLLINPNNAGVAQDLPSIIGAAGPLGIKLEVVKASTENELTLASTEPNYRAMYPI
jgi:hypothetical protein